MVTGGSQGAKIFGDVIPQVVKRLNLQGILKCINQQCIKNQKDTLEKFYKQNNINHLVFEFDNDIFNKIVNADLVITRSGASTIGELAQLNKPFVAVPFPTAMDNHQMENAKYYFDKGCCWIIDQKNFNGETLFNLINKIYNDKNEYLSKVKKMSELKKVVSFGIIEKEFNNLLK